MLLKMVLGEKIDACNCHIIVNLNGLEKVRPQKFKAFDIIIRSISTNVSHSKLGPVKVEIPSEVHSELNYVFV